MSCCLVILNIGNRKYLESTLPLFKSYCERTQTDLKIIERLSTPLLPKIYFKLLKWRQKRPYVEAYYEKMLIIGKLLEDYDNVILMDDTCIVAPHVPNLLSIVPKNCIGAFNESSLDVRSWKQDRAFLYKKTKVMIDEYYNTGVLVVPSIHKEIFSKKTLWKHRNLFLRSGYPCQAFFAHVVEINKSIQMFKLPESYNYMHSHDENGSSDRKLKKFSESYLKEKRGIDIHHITGYFQHRDLIIKQVCNHIKDNKAEHTDQQLS